jgi:ABC-type transporter Mla subunit MlaD
MEDIMSAVTDLTNAVNAQSTVVDSAVTLLQSLAQQIRDNVDNSDALNALADEIEANTSELADAVSANTPAEQPPVEEQPPVDETNPDDLPHPDQTLPGDLPQ